MKAYLLAFLTASLAFAAATFLVNGLNYGHNLESLLKFSAIFGLFEVLVRPIIKILLLPLNFLTMGLLSGIGGIVILWLMSVVIPGFSITDTSFPSGYGIPSYTIGPIFTIIVGAFIISLINAILFKFIK